MTLVEGRPPAQAPPAPPGACARCGGLVGPAHEVLRDGAPTGELVRVCCGVATAWRPGLAGTASAAGHARGEQLATRWAKAAAAFPDARLADLGACVATDHLWTAPAPTDRHPGWREYLLACAER